MTIVKVNMKKIRDRFAGKEPELYDSIVEIIEEDQDMELICTVLYEITLQRKHEKLANEKMSREPREIMKKMIMHNFEIIIDGYIDAIDKDNINMEKIHDKYAEENEELFEYMINSVEEDQEMELLFTVMYEILSQKKWFEQQNKEKPVCGECDEDHCAEPGADSDSIEDCEDFVEE